MHFVELPFVVEKKMENLKIQVKELNIGELIHNVIYHLEQYKILINLQVRKLNQILLYGLEIVHHMMFGINNNGIKHYLLK